MNSVTPASMHKIRSLIALLLTATLLSQDGLAAASFAAPRGMPSPLPARGHLLEQALSERMIFQLPQALVDRFVTSRVFRMQEGHAAAVREGLLPLRWLFTGWHGVTGFEYLQILLAQPTIYASAALGILAGMPLELAVVTGHTVHNDVMALAGGRQATLPQNMIPRDWFELYGKAKKHNDPNPVEVIFTPADPEKPARRGVVEKIDEKEKKVFVRFSPDEGLRQFPLPDFIRMLEIQDLPAEPVVTKTEESLEEAVAIPLRVFLATLRRAVESASTVIESNPDLAPDMPALKAEASAMAVGTLGRVRALPVEIRLQGAERIAAFATASANALIFFAYAPELLFFQIARVGGNFRVSTPQAAQIVNDLHDRANAISPGAILHSLRGPNARLDFTFIILARLLRFRAISNILLKHHSGPEQARLDGKGITTEPLNETVDTMNTKLAPLPRGIEEFIAAPAQGDPTLPVGLLESSDDLDFWTKPGWMAHPYHRSFVQWTEKGVMARYRTALAEDAAGMVYLYVHRVDVNRIRDARDERNLHGPELIRQGLYALRQMAQKAGLVDALIAPVSNEPWVLEQIGNFPTVGKPLTLSIVGGTEILRRVAKDISGADHTDGTILLYGLDSKAPPLRWLRPEEPPQEKARQRLDATWRRPSVWKQMVENELARRPTLHQSPETVDSLEETVQQFFFTAAKTFLLGQNFENHLHRAVEGKDTLSMGQLWWLYNAMEDVLLERFSPTFAQRNPYAQIDWSAAPHPETISPSKKRAYQNYFNSLQNRMNIVLQWTLVQKTPTETIDALTKQGYKAEEIRKWLFEMSRSISNRWEVFISAYGEDYLYFSGARARPGESPFFRALKRLFWASGGVTLAHELGHDLPEWAAGRSLEWHWWEILWSGVSRAPGFARYRGARSNALVGALAASALAVMAYYQVGMISQIFVAWVAILQLLGVIVERRDRTGDFAPLYGRMA